MVWFGPDLGKLVRLARYKSNGPVARKVVVKTTAKNTETQEIPAVV